MSDGAASGRLGWVVEQLEGQPSDCVLEVGGGHGVAGSLVLRRLDSGRLVGLDRSPKMIAAATRRNEVAVLAGRAEFIIGSVGDTTLEGRCFDCIFAARVVAPTKPQGLAWAAGLLEPGGVLNLAFDSPDDAVTRAAADAAIGNLPAAGLQVAAATDERLEGALVMCVRAVHGAPD